MAKLPPSATSDIPSSRDIRLFENSRYYTCNQETTSAATILRYVSPVKAKLRGGLMRVATVAGTSGNTTVTLNINGSAVSGATGSVASTASNGTEVAIPGGDAQVQIGDEVEVVVTAVTAGTASSGLSVRIQVVDDLS